MLSFLKTLGLSLLSVFAPIKPVLLTSLAMVMIDLITGILAARHRGEKITSAGLQRTIVKLTVYMLAIMLSYVTEKYLTGSSIALCKIASSFVGITELTSVMENLNDISGGSALKALIAKLGSKNGDTP